MMHIEKKGFEMLQQNLLKSKTVVQREMTTAISNSVKGIHLAAKNNVAVGARGDLKRSIMYHVDEENLVGVVGLDAPGRQYGIYVEKGTKPHWVPRAALERWASQRGIPVFLVQRAIARKGTKAQPFMMPAFTNNQAFVKRQFTTAHKKILEAFHG